MQIKHVERYTIQLNNDTTVYDLYKALGKLPNNAVISNDYGVLYATFENEPIDA